MMRMVIGVTVSLFSIQGFSYTGHYIVCNGCSIPAMRNAATNMGAGEHLVIDAYGKKGQIVIVDCGAHIDGVEGPSLGADRENSKAEGNLDSGYICWVQGVRWTTDDQAALDFIKDELKSDGTFSKSATVNSNQSIYAIAVDPVYNLNPIRQSLWSNVLTSNPGWTVWSALSSWGMGFFGFGPGSNVQVIIVFPDGTMEATIDMSWINNGPPVLNEPPLNMVQLHTDTAIDSAGNLVPNLSGPPEMNSVTFYFGSTDGAPAGWIGLMEGLGYSFPTNPGPGTSWICGSTSVAGGPPVRSCVRGPF